MQSSGSVPEIVGPSARDADWESNSVASTPLPDQNFEFLIPQEDTRPRPRSAGGTNRPTKSEQVDELVRFFETHDGPEAERKQSIQQQNSRSYNIALGLFKAGRRRVRQFTQPKADRWVKRETVEGRTYRYIAVPERLSVFDTLPSEEQEPENRNPAQMGDEVMNHGDGDTTGDSVLSGPQFFDEIETQGEGVTGNPGDHFYPGIGELPPLIGFSLPLSKNARDTATTKESDSHKITERQNSASSVRSNRSNQERTPARVRFDVGTSGVEAKPTVSHYNGTKINGAKINNDDRREDEIEESELSKASSSTGDVAKISAHLLRTTENRADAADSTQIVNFGQDVSFQAGSSESASSTPGLKSLSCGTNSPSPPRALNPGVSAQGIQGKRTWRRSTRILQQGSSGKIIQDRLSRSRKPSSHAVLPSTSTLAESIPSAQPFDEYFIPFDMKSSLAMQSQTGSALGSPQSQYTFLDIENDNSKRHSASPANKIPYDGPPTSPPRPAPTKPLPSLPKNKAPRGSTPSQDNDSQFRSHTHTNASHSSVDTKESQSPAKQGKLTKSPSRSIRRTRSALSRSHIKLHDGSTSAQNVSSGTRSNEGGNQNATSTPSRDEQKLSAERQERINRAERVYAVRMKDICAARARLENKMLEVREAGGDAIADEFTHSESRILNNQEAEREGEREAARGEDLIGASRGNRDPDGVGRDNNHHATFSQRLPTTTPSPPPKVPLPADPPISLLGAFSIESILRGSSNPSHRRLEISPVMTVYDQWPTHDGNSHHQGSVYRGNSKRGSRHTPKGYQKTSFHWDSYVPHSGQDKPINALPRPSSILTNGKATPPRSTSPSLASIDGEQPGHGDSSANNIISTNNEWKAHIKHQAGHSYGTPECQGNGTTPIDNVTSIQNDDYILPLSPRVRSTHSRTKTAESHLSEPRHQQPHSSQSQPHQPRNSNTVQPLESRVAVLERQNKMLQAALMSALDVGVTLDAENIRGGTPMRSPTTADGSDFGQGPSPRLKRNSNIISRRPNSWLSVRSAQSRRSMGATSSGSEGTGVKAIEAMIGNLELGWSGDCQSTDVHKDCRAQDRVQHET